MLRDSAHIQEFEAEWRNRKARRSGEPEYEPIYTVADADAATKLLAPVDYGQKITLCDGIEVRFNDVGHLLGSASIEVWVTEGEVSKKIVFSGDVGNKNQPIIKDPQLVKEADYVVIESTYGDRTHGEDIPDYVGEFTRILREPIVLSVFTSNSCMRIVRCPLYSGLLSGASSLLTIYALPSSSKKKEGSIPPTSGNMMGSDHSPNGSCVLTKKFPAPTLVVTI